MRRVETNDPGKLAYNEGGGCVSLFGLPFLVMGLFAMVMALAGQMKLAGLGGMIFGAVFGLIFAGVGAALVFGRSGVVFDKSAKTVTRWYGLLVPMWSRSYDIKLFREVTVSKEVQHGSHGTTCVVYPVRLTGPSARPLELSQTQDERNALKLAEEVAAFINLDMVNGLGGVTLRREAGTVDEPLRDRLRRLGKDVAITAPPEGLRATFSARGNAVFFIIPPPRPSLGMFAPVGCAAVFASFVGVIFLGPLLTDKTMPVQAKLLFAAFLGVFFILLPLAAPICVALSKLRRRSRIEVDSYSLRITTQGALSSNHVEIPSEELEELQLEENKGEYCLAAVSKKQLARFGEGLSRAELEWMRDVVLRALAS